MWKLCLWCKLEIMRWKYTRQFCSVQCRLEYNRYERQINKLHYNLINKIYVTPESLRVRKYKKDNMIDKIISMTKKEPKHECDVISHSKYIDNKIASRLSLATPIGLPFEIWLNQEGLVIGYNFYRQEVER